MAAKAFSFLLLFISINAYSADITVNFPDGIKKTLKIIKSVDGKYFPGTLWIQNIAEKKQVVFKNDLTKPGLLQVYFDKPYTFYISPNKSCVISLAQKDTEQSFSFDGQDAQGQYWLNRLAHQSYQAKAASYLSKDSTLRGIEKLLDSDIAKEHAEVEQMKMAGSITPSFYQYSLLEIDYYYAAVFAQIIFDSQSKPAFVAQWPKLFARLSLTTDAPLATMSFYDYADQYASWYKTSYFRKLSGTAKRFDVKKSNDYLVDWYQRFADNLIGHTKEYMLARFLYGFSNMKKYEPELVDLYNQFDQLYPKSIYKPYVRPAIEAIISYRSDTKPMVSGVEFLDAYSSIFTTQDLLAKLGAGVTYIDIWATWCGPCKEEFAYAPELHNFLSGKKAKILYLSFDINERDTDWKKMIDNYGLAGIHIRANDQLRQNIIDKLWKSRSYAIPRYLIVKNGVIVSEDALRPSDKRRLYDQLDTYL